MKKYIQIVASIALLITFTNAWPRLICQTKEITPGMLIDDVTSLCGSPYDQTDKKENLVCGQGVQTSCQKIYTQTLTYKRPSIYIVEFQNDKVFSVRDSLQ